MKRYKLSCKLAVNWVSSARNKKAEKYLDRISTQEVVITSYSIHYTKLYEQEEIAGLAATDDVSVIIRFDEGTDLTALRGDQVVGEIVPVVVALQYGRLGGSASHRGDLIVVVGCCRVAKAVRAIVDSYNFV